MKAVVAAFNQEKALVGAFSVITNLRMELFEALIDNVSIGGVVVSLVTWSWPADTSCLATFSLHRWSPRWGQARWCTLVAGVCQVRLLATSEGGGRGAQQRPGCYTYISQGELHLAFLLFSYFVFLYLLCISTLSTFIYIVHLPYLLRISTFYFV